MREMKDSGVEWVGKIPVGWETIKMKYTTYIFTGNSIKDDEKQYYEDKYDAIPYIATKDINALNNSINYNNGMYIKLNDKTFTRAKPNDILMCIEGGSAGKKKAYLEQGVCFINKLCCFSCQTINSKYLYYVMNSPHYEAEFNLHMNGLIGGVTKSKLKSFLIPFPDNEVQKEISIYLDDKCSKIDEIIAKEDIIIKKLEVTKISLITEVVTTGLSKVKMKKSKNTWVNEIPYDWIESKLKYHMYIRARLGWKGLKSDEYVEHGYLLLSAFNIINNKLSFNKVNYINRFRYDESPEIKITIGDVLLVKDGAGIGKCAYVDYLPCEATPNGSLALIRDANVLENNERKLVAYRQSEIENIPLKGSLDFKHFKDIHKYLFQDIYT